MKLLGTLVLTAAGAVACSTTSSTMPLDWRGFINEFPGNGLQLDDYPGATTKVAAVPNAVASAEAGNARFERWCSAHDGKSALASQLAGVNPAAGSLNSGLGAKVNAERAGGLPWTATTTLACVKAKSPQELIAAMVTVTGRPSEARQVDGKMFDKLTRAFFDKDGAAAFGAAYAKREADRSIRVAAQSQELEAHRLAATERLRRSPQVGDLTSVGVIVDVRPPLALVQYHDAYRALKSLPAAEWLRIDQLTAPSPPP